MRNRILEIVVYLMDVMRDQRDQDASADEISSALQNMGYSEHEINTAYNWFLNQFGETAEQFYSSFPKKHSSTRILTESERAQISTEAYGFLLKLVQSDLLSDEQLEMILDRVTMFTTDQVSVDQMKVAVSSVLFKGLYDMEDNPLFDTTVENPQSVN